MNKCDVCGTVMVVCIYSSFCPECEKTKTQQAAPTPVTAYVPAPQHTNFLTPPPSILTAAPTQTTPSNTAEAVDACIDIEYLIEGMGWHVGLTGGCLYKQGKRKDVDFIIYPHIVDPSFRYTDAEILSVVKEISRYLGFGTNQIIRSAQYKDGKQLYKIGMNIDVFVFGV